MVTSSWAKRHRLVARHPYGARVSSRRWTLLAVPLVIGGLSVFHRDLVDLAVYRYGADRVLSGAPLYAPRAGLPFTYPPFAALLMAPLALLTWSAASALLTSLSVAGLAVAVRRPSLLVLAVACAFEPVRQTLSFGQVNLILCALVLADLTWRPERPWRGALLGVTIGIKLTPLFFVGYLVVTRQWEALRNALLAATATVGVAFVVLPGTSWEYWTRVVRDAERIGGLAYSGNQSVMGVLTRFGIEQWWLPVASACGVLSLYVAHRLRHDPLAAACVTALGMLLASPVSWSHHWVWAVPLTAVLWHRSRVWMAAWVALFVAGPHWWPPYTDDQEIGWYSWQLAAGNSYVLAAVALLLALAVSRSACRPRKSSGSRENQV